MIRPYQPRVDAETAAEIEKELDKTEVPKPATEVKSVETKPATEVKVIDPNRGAATRARWSAVLKSRPGAKLLLASDVKPLARNSVITAMVDGNPKKQAAEKRYRIYGFDGKKGAVTTIGAYIDEVTKNPKFTANIAVADIAWDINHGFIALEVAEKNPEPLTVEQPKPEASEVAAA
jgi:hypothetical protein